MSSFVGFEGGSAFFVLDLKPETLLFFVFIVFACADQIHLF